MTCISRSPRFYMRVLPVLLLVMLLVVTAFQAGDVVRGRTSVAGLLLWAFIAFGYLISWLHAFGVADEVWDAGDHLLVKMKGKVDRVPIADVESVSESTAIHPHRITLRLARPGRFGRTVVFWPALDVSCLIPFMKSRVGETLAERIDRTHATES